MDDQQNQNIQPAPSAPPIDITPPITPPVPPVLPVPEPVTTSAPQPFQAPAPEPFPTPAPITPELTVTEPPMPEVKPKKKIVPIVGAIVALFLVVGVAGAAYYVSNQLSTRQAVAPNAPSSKPLADDACTNGETSDQGCGAYGCLANERRNCECSSDNAPFHWSCSCDEDASCGDGGGGGGGGGGEPTCDATKRDTPSSNSITFAKSGTVKLFTRNAGGGTVTLTGPKTVTIQTEIGDAVQNATTFPVTAGETYTIKLKFSDPSEQGKDAYGWIPNKSDNVCGPVKAEGPGIDANSKSTGFCGGPADITTVRNLALANADLNDIAAGGTNATIQCWGDAELGDPTQDYDYDDTTLIFGFEKTQTGGACMLIDIYKKVDGVYGATPLAHEELIALKVGDILRLSWTGSIDNLQGRVRATISTTPTNSTVGDWLSGQLDVTNKKLFTYDGYAITVAGTYNFEAQVSTTP